MISLHGKMMSGAQATPNQIERNQNQREIWKKRTKVNGKWNWHRANGNACNRLANRVVLLTISCVCVCVTL